MTSAAIIRTKLFLVITSMLSISLYLFFIVLSETKHSIFIAILAVVLVGTFFHFRVLPIMRLIKNPEIKIIYNGYDSRSALLYGAAWLALSWMTIHNGHELYAFIGFGAVLLVLSEKFNLIVFNFSDRSVSGLLDSRKQLIDKMVIVHDSTNSPETIRITEDHYVYDLKCDKFSEEAWNDVIDTLQILKRYE